MRVPAHLFSCGLGGNTSGATMADAGGPTGFLSRFKQQLEAKEAEMLSSVDTNRLDGHASRSRPPRAASAAPAVRRSSVSSSASSASFGPRDTTAAPASRSTTRRPSGSRGSNAAPLAQVQTRQPSGAAAPPPSSLQREWMINTPSEAQQPAERAVMSDRAAHRGGELAHTSALVDMSDFGLSGEENAVIARAASDMARKQAAAAAALSPVATGGAQTDRAWPVSSENGTRGHSFLTSTLDRLGLFGGESGGDSGDSQPGSAPPRVSDVLKGARATWSSSGMMAMPPGGSVALPPVPPGMSQPQSETGWLPRVGGGYVSAELREALTARDNAHEQLRALLSTLQAMSDDHVRITSENSSLQAALAASQAKVMELEGRVGFLESERNTITASTAHSVQGAQAHIAALERELDQQAARMDSLIKERDAAVDAAARVRAEPHTDVLKAQRASLALQKDLAAARSSITELSRENRKLREDVAAAQREVVVAQSAAAAATSALNAPATREADTIHALTAARASVESMRQARDEAESAARVAKAAAASLRDKLASQQAVFDMTVSDLQQALQLSAGQLGELRKALQAAKAVPPPAPPQQDRTPPPPPRRTNADVQVSASIQEHDAVGQAFDGDEEAAAHTRGGHHGGRLSTIMEVSEEHISAFASPQSSSAREDGPSRRSSAGAGSTLVAYARSLEDKCRAVTRQLGVTRLAHVLQGRARQHLHAWAAAAGVRATAPARASWEATLTAELERGNDEHARLRTHALEAAKRAEEAERQSRAFATEAAESRSQLQALQVGITSVLSQLGAAGRLTNAPAQRRHAPSSASLLVSMSDATASRSHASAVDMLDHALHEDDRDEASSTPSVTPEALSAAASAVQQFRQQADAMRILLQQLSPDAFADVLASPSRTGAAPPPPGMHTHGATSSKTLADAVRRLERSLVTTVRTFSATRSTLQAKLSEFESKSAALHTAVTSETDKLRAAEGDMEAARAARAEAEAQAMSAQRLVSDLREQLSASQRACAQAEMEATRTRNAWKAATADLEAANAEADALRTAAAKAKSDAENVRNRSREALQAAREQFIMDTAHMTQTRDEALERCSTLQARCETYLSELKELRVAAAAAESALEDERATSRARIAELQSTHATYVSGATDAAAAQARALQEEYEKRLTAAHASAQERALSQAAAAAAHDSEISTLRREHDLALQRLHGEHAAALARAQAQHDAKVQQLVQDVQGMHSDMQRISEQSKQMEAVSRTLREDNDMLRAQIVAVTSTLQSAEASATQNAAAAMTTRAELQRVQDELTRTREAHAEELQSVQQECQYAIQAAEDKAQGTVAVAIAAYRRGGR